MSFDSHDQVGLSREDASALARRARVYLYADGTYRTTPTAPRRLGIVKDRTVTSSRDADVYKTNLAAFQEIWEAMPLRQQAYILGRAHARDRREWTVELDNSGKHATIKCDGVDEMVLHSIHEDARYRFDCWPILPVTLYFDTEHQAEDFRQNHPRFADGKILDLSSEGAAFVRWQDHDGAVLFGDLGEAMRYSAALAAHYPEHPAR